jgi:V8-like Glu-specific endopeptidase
MTAAAAILPHACGPADPAAILPQPGVSHDRIAAMEASLRLLSLALCLFALPALAEDSPLTTLMTADDAQGWEAVGRIDLDGQGFCTGTLIAPDTVLTAAHCLYDGDSGIRFADESISFLAGWRNGQALATRSVRRSVAHPDYVHDPESGANNSRFDLALLILDQPIRSTQVVPIPVAEGEAIGDEVGIVSYAHDRAEAPALQRVCGVIGSEAGVVVLSCNVDFGSSGAPVFHLGAAGPRIVSVVSAKADYDGSPVAVGVLLDDPLAVLRAIVAEGEGLFRDGVPTGVRVLTGGERAETGARFVRP